MTHPSRTDAEYQPLPHDPAYADMESPHELETIAHFDNWAAPAQETGASGRRVLGATLVVLGAVWVGYTAWAAGRALAGAPLSDPVVAQWLAVVTGPLALLGLVWIMFGRTRRKEAEAFSRSVVAMRTEAQALQSVLGALSQQIDENHRALGQMSGELMAHGDAAATRINATTETLRAGSADLVAHAEALDRAANAARTDFGVILGDLPRAEESALRMASALRDAGASATEQAQRFEGQVQRLSEETRTADATVGEAAGRLMVHLTQIESAGAAASTRLTDAAAAGSASVDELLIRASDALTSVRTGIDEQAASVAALVERAQAGLSRAGIDASDALGQRLDSAQGALDRLTAQIAEQDRASQRLLADIDQGLLSLDQRFVALAEAGDERTQRVSAQIGSLRQELHALGSDTGGHDQALLALSDRTQALRDGIGQLAALVTSELGTAIDAAEAGAGRLYQASSEAHPLITGARDAAVEASERIKASGQSLAEQAQAWAALNAELDSGLGSADERVGALRQAIAGASEDADRLSNETSAALLAALTQVREAATHAGDRAREAISAAIPDSAAQLGDEARKALEQVVRDTVARQLAEVDRVAVHAVESARAASDRLTQQMLSIGQSAVALEDYVEKSREAAKKDDGEDFSRRVSLLIDSMHSAAIDVQKILSDEVDEKAWGSYLKGNRGVFTRRAARLIGSSEQRGLSQHYETDGEFRLSVDRFVHDFEAMLRRMTSERDGGPIAVTMMSSDIGKLYAALAPVIDRRR